MLKAKKKKKLTRVCLYSLLSSGSSMVVRLSSLVWLLVSSLIAGGHLSHGDLFPAFRETQERQKALSPFASQVLLIWSIQYAIVGYLGVLPPWTPTYICLLFSYLKAKLFELTLFTHSELNKGSTINNCFFILSKTSESWYGYEVKNYEFIL